MLYCNKAQNNINFGHKLKTVNVLEVTTQKIIQSSGLEGPKKVILTLYDKPFKGTGHRGFKYMAENIGAKITAKYPEINEATNQIKNILKQNPDIKKQQLNELVKPIIEKIGENIDITL